MLDHENVTSTADDKVEPFDGDDKVTVEQVVKFLTADQAEVSVS